MLDNLPEPSRVVLPNPPLLQASLAVAWTQEVGFTTDMGVRLRASLHGHPNLGQAARLTTASLQTFALNMTGVDQTEQVDGWQVNSKGFSVSLYPAMMVIEDRAYTTWEDFLIKIGPTFVALAELAAPKVRTRVMLRYSNLLIDSAFGPACWHGKIRTEFLGAAANDAVSALVAGSVGISTLQEGTVDAQLRTNIGRSATGSSYAIDIECNERAIVEYTTDSILETMAEQNTMCLRLFQMVLEPTFFANLRTKS